MSIDRPVLVVLLANLLFAGTSAVVIGTAVLVKNGPSALLLAIVALGAWAIVCGIAVARRLHEPGRIYLW